MSEDDRKKLWKIASHMRLVAKPGVGLCGKTLDEYADILDGIAGKSVTTPENCVKVRIAVAVNNKREWNSCGWSDAVDDKELKTVVLDCFDPAEAEAVHFIEAAVPLPVVETIPAEVV